MVYETVRELPAWAVCCNNIDVELNYVYPLSDGYAVFLAAQTVNPFVTIGDLIAIAAQVDSYPASGKRSPMDVLLITKKEIYGTKGLILDKIADDHYQVTELQPTAFLTFLAGLKTLTISVIGNCIVVEDHALSEDNRPPQTDSG